MPLVTPMTDDASSISEVRLARLIRALASYQAAGLVVGSEVGQFHALSSAERKDMTEWAIRETRGQTHVFVHITATTTPVALDLAQHAARHGARAVILGPPIYGRFTSDELTRYLHTVSCYIDLPILIVDPRHQFSSEVHEALAPRGNVHFAQSLQSPTHQALAVRGGTWSDEFAIDQAVCTSLLAIPRELHTNALRNVMRQAGPERVVRAVLDRAEIGVGQARGPQSELTLDQLRELEAASAERAA